MYTIKFGDSDVVPNSISVELRVTDAKGTTAPIRFTLPDLERVRLDWASLSDDEVIEHLVTFGVRRLEKMIELGTYTAPDVGHVGEMLLEASYDKPLLVSSAGLRECRYLTFEAGDPYCSASSPADESTVGSSGLRRLAPTTHAVCGECEMPKEPHACSALHHVQVLGFAMLSGGDASRQVGSAMCMEGILTDDDPSSCTPLGRDCWRRTADATARQMDSAPPLALAEAVDFLDVVWKARFGQHLMKRTSLALAASLEQPVRSREDFKARITDLATILELDVPAELLPAEFDSSKGSVLRLQAVVETDSIGISEAIDALRGALWIRTALSHQHKSSELQPALGALGVESLVDPERAWDIVRSRVLEAVIEIRNVVRNVE